MTEMRHGTADTEYDRNAPTGWVGWIVFAGVMMMVVGGWNMITGFVALFKDDYYVVRSSGLVLSFDYTGWGWIHLILGAIIFAVGIGALAGQTWARVAGVIAVSINALVQFTFLKAYPFWSTIVIAVDVFVIYALIVHGREVREDR